MRATVRPPRSEAHVRVRRYDAHSMCCASADITGSARARARALNKSTELDVIFMGEALRLPGIALMQYYMERPCGCVNTANEINLQCAAPTRASARVAHFAPGDKSWPKHTNAFVFPNLPWVTNELLAPTLPSSAICQ